MGGRVYGRDGGGVPREAESIDGECIYDKQIYWVKGPYWK